MMTTLYLPTPLRKLTNGQSKAQIATTSVADWVERVLDADGGAE